MSRRKCNICAAHNMFFCFNIYVSTHAYNVFLLQYVRQHACDNNSARMLIVYVSTHAIKISTHAVPQTHAFSLQYVRQHACYEQVSAQRFILYTIRLDSKLLFFRRSITGAMSASCNINAHSGHKKQNLAIQNNRN